MQLAEIIEDWTGWCPKKQRASTASRTDFLSGETPMKSAKSTGRRTKSIAAVVLMFIAAFAGMRLEFDGMQSLDWLMRDSKAVEGNQWLANNKSWPGGIMPTGLRR